MSFVRATFDYDATEDSELTMREGDIIEVLQEDASGWWRGLLDGIEGVFPSNFTEPYEDEFDEPEPEPEPEPEVEVPTQQRSAQPVNLMQGINMNELKGAMKKKEAAKTVGRKTKKTEPKKELVVARHDYQGAAEDDELSFAGEDIITVLKKDNSGWWQGELREEVGWFPSTFVRPLTKEEETELLSDDEPEPAPVAAAAPVPQASPAPAPVKMAKAQKKAAKRFGVKKKVASGGVPKKEERQSSREEKPAGPSGWPASWPALDQLVEDLQAVLKSKSKGINPTRTLEGRNLDSHALGLVWDGTVLHQSGYLGAVSLHETALTLLGHGDAGETAAHLASEDAQLEEVLAQYPALSISHAAYTALLAHSPHLYTAAAAAASPDLGLKCIAGVLALGGSTTAIASEFAPLGDGFWSASNGLLIWTVKRLTIVCFDPHTIKSGKEMISSSYSALDKLIPK